MSEARQCGECGQHVPADASGGHCPICLLRYASSAAPAMPRPPPDLGRTPTGWRVIGDFELLERFPDGGMGVVYRARQISLDRVVALKMIKPGALGSHMLMDRLLQEAQLAGSLKHPNIVSIYSVGDFEGEPYICMELIEGAALDKHLTPEGYSAKVVPPASPFPETPSEVAPIETVVRIMAKIVLAVHCAHQHAVLHRDLKPANILIDAQGEPHLADFGLAKLLGPGAVHHTQDGAILGTPSYMAPEQASGATKLISTAADVYSLGAVLYAMLTGRAPFAGATPLEVIQKVVDKEPIHPTTLRKAVDLDLATICLKCLEKDPSRRYCSADALARDLEHWLRQEPIQARPVGSLSKAWRWCRREPALASLVSGVFLLLSLVSVLLYILYRRADEQATTSENQRVKAESQLMRRIEEESINPEISVVRLYADDIRTLLKQPPAPFPAPGPNFTVGLLAVNFPRRPDTISHGYAGLLDYLGTNNPAFRLRLHLYIFKKPADAISAVRQGEVQLLRLSPAAYVAGRQEAPLRPLVQELPWMGSFSTLAALAHRDSPGRPWADVSNLTVLFAKRHMLPDDIPFKAFLYDQGLRATNFARCLELGLYENALMHIRTNRELIGAEDLAQLQGQLDSWRLHYTNPPPVILLATNIPCTQPVWIVSDTVSPAIVGVVQRSLCALTNRSILKPLLGDLDGFRAARPEDFDAFENQYRKAQLFEGAADVAAQGGP